MRKTLEILSFIIMKFSLSCLIIVLVQGFCTNDIVPYLEVDMKNTANITTKLLAVDFIFNHECSLRLSCYLNMAINTNKIIKQECSATDVVSIDYETHQKDDNYIFHSMTSQASKYKLTMDKFGEVIKKYNPQEADTFDYNYKTKNYKLSYNPKNNIYSFTMPLQTRLNTPVTMIGYFPTFEYIIENNNISIRKHGDIDSIIQVVKLDNDYTILPRHYDCLSKIYNPRTPKFITKNTIAIFINKEIIVRVQRGYSIIRSVYNYNRLIKTPRQFIKSMTTIVCGELKTCVINKGDSPEGYYYIKDHNNQIFNMSFYGSFGPGPSVIDWQNKDGVLSSIIQEYLLDDDTQYDDSTVEPLSTAAASITSSIIDIKIIMLVAIIAVLLITLLVLIICIIKIRRTKNRRRIVRLDTTYKIPEHQPLSQITDSLSQNPYTPTTGTETPV